MPAIAAAEPPATGRPRVLVRGSVPRGIDAHLPREGAYLRAIEAVERGRFRLAAVRFLDAQAELRRAAKHEAGSPCLPDPDDEGACVEPTPTLVRALLRRITFELRQARWLSSEAGRGDGGPGFVDDRLQTAAARTNLFLAVRAFRGRDVPALRQQAEKAWRDLLLVAGGDAEMNARGHLGLAGVLADAGTDEGKRAAAAELERVPLADRKPELCDYFAHYYAALGEIDTAFAVLAAARDALPDWNDVALQLRASNDLDALRDDPRYAALVGAE